jgi:hypothetical protein
VAHGGIAAARIDGLLVSVTVPPGDLPQGAQVTLLAPSVQGIGNAGHSRYRTVAGAGVLIQVNGRTCAGAVAKPITMELSGRQIRPGDRAAVWNGTNFAFIAGRAAGNTEEFGYRSGAEQDFAVLAPGHGASREQHPGQQAAMSGS